MCQVGNWGFVELLILVGICKCHVQKSAFPPSFSVFRTGVIYSVYNTCEINQPANNSRQCSWPDSAIEMSGLGNYLLLQETLTNSQSIPFFHLLSGRDVTN